MVKVSESERKELTVEFDGFPSSKREFVSASEWTNGEGVDLCVNDRQLQLTWMELDALVAAAQLIKLRLESPK